MRAFIPALRLMQTAALELPRAALLVRSSAVDVAASAPAVCLGPELALQVHLVDFDELLA
jgi:hypothetical protein